MQWRTTLIEALRSLAYYRRRSVITVMSLAWGVASFLILMSYGSGFEVALTSAFRAVGPDLVITFNGQTSTQAGGLRAGRPIRMRLNDVEAIRESVPAVAWISPELFVRNRKVMYGTTEKDYLARGVRAEYQSIRNMKLTQGRWLNLMDSVQRNRVAVVGATVASELFRNGPALGETITVGGIRFEVIGVLEAKVQISNYNRPDNHCLFIPYETAGIFRDLQHPDMIVWMPRSPQVSEQAIRQVRAAFAGIHRFSPTDEKAVEILAFSQFMGIITGMSLALQGLLGFVGTLTLGIGGVGLTNIMLASVLERTREIGVMRAVGCRRRTVLMQFLNEALLIVAFGGVLGLLFSVGAVHLISSLPFLSGIFDDLGDDVGRLQLQLSPLALFLSMGILFVVGLVAGLIPAIRAANLDPVRALQYE
ncbi:MAG: ABC transporter permease [Bryobacterales bacterium]|jgi:putative ABC transport system permease protein|nr:ABC transporter permease [Bryobacterales bacterium]